MVKEKIHLNVREEKRRRTKTIHVRKKSETRRSKGERKGERKPYMKGREGRKGERRLREK